jgi:alkylhydroperoxidase family enzyme
MPVINPVPKEKAPAELHGLYDKLTQAIGHMPNIFGVMAQRPNVLQAFMSLYGAIINEGTVEPRYKELAYLKTSQVNGCEY